jgi:hypothetical protein
MQKSNTFQYSNFRSTRCYDQPAAHYLYYSWQWRNGQPALHQFITSAPDGPAGAGAGGARHVGMRGAGPCRLTHNRQPDELLHRHDIRPHGGAALKSGGSAQNESKFSVISSRRQPSGRRDGLRLTPLRMCSCGRGLARAYLLVLPWSVCLGRPAESRARPGRAHSAVETAIPVALVVDFRALQVASKGSRAPARSQRSRHVPSSSAHIPSGS